MPVELIASAIKLAVETDCDATTGPTNLELELTANQLATDTLLANTPEPIVVRFEPIVALLATIRPVFGARA